MTELYVQGKIVTFAFIAARAILNLLLRANSLEEHQCHFHQSANKLLEVAHLASRTGLSYKTITAFEYVLKYYRNCPQDSGLLCIHFRAAIPTERFLNSAKSFPFL